MSRALKPLSLGLFNKKLVSEYLCDLDECASIVERRNSFKHLLDEAEDHGSYSYCNGNIVRITSNGINIEYWVSSNGLRLYIFKLILWDNGVAEEYLLLVFEGRGESYLSGICRGKHIESYIEDKDCLILLMFKYSEKLSWECIE